METAAPRHSGSADSAVDSYRHPTTEISACAVSHDQAMMGWLVCPSLYI